MCRKDTPSQALSVHNIKTRRYIIMDEQHAWLRARRKRHLRILAVMLSFCVLFTTCPDILVTLSVLATGKPEQAQGQYVSGFAELPEEIREQTVPVGTGLEELSLPDTLEAVVTGESRPSGDGENVPEDNGGEDTGEDTGEDKEDAADEPDGGITDTEDKIHAYGRYRNVFLSSAELAELQTELPSLWEQYIERLSEYMESSGKGYKNHAATIRRWANADKKKEEPPARNRDYSVEEGETI